MIHINNKEKQKVIRNATLVKISFDLLLWTFIFVLIIDIIWTMIHFIGEPVIDKPAQFRLLYASIFLPLGLLSLLIIPTIIAYIMGASSKAHRDLVMQMYLESKTFKMNKVIYRYARCIYPFSFKKELNKFIVIKETND
ncbi:hypothetical protein [Mycoplasmopsis verecunda]|uniref:Uncharacterized protein n=1 Tax=Mycoplasmopsis verecunda TaxID=171291 RepID=A0A1T4L034_9BACT|nr:hypothetical protein [Mycoplasmopsis verecunda]WPB54410.1 hypothetical protein SAM46_02885 [Mycoplasmopsis verecunda]SJZ48065.1 hypothetical protein SAMN02745154_00265 [Mycoplasmopsis verecunda]